MKNSVAAITKALVEIKKSIDKAAVVLNETAEKWTTKYINDLPNAAFAVVEKGYKEGDSKSARHLPHHSSGVKSSTENSSVDLSHYRNALARANQIKSVLGKETDAALRKKAANHLAKHRAVLKKSKADFLPAEQVIWEDCEKLFFNDVRPLISGKEKA